MGGETLGEVFGMVLVELCAPQRLGHRRSDHPVILVVLPHTGVGVVGEERVRPVHTDGPDDLLAKRNFAGVTKGVGRPVPVLGGGDPEPVHGGGELLERTGDGGGLVHPDRVPTVVGDPAHDHPPARSGEPGDGATAEQGRVVGVGGDDEHDTALTGGDVGDHGAAHDPPPFGDDVATAGSSASSASTTLGPPVGPTENDSSYCDPGFR